MRGLIDPDAFEALAPAGFYLALRVGFAFPIVEHNRLPATWVREYTVSGLIVHDPTISWAYKNCGVARWSELAPSDAQGVLDLAKNHGLNFGAVASWIDAGEASQRSFGFFCRADRELHTSELDLLKDLLVSAHRACARPQNLTIAELEALNLVKNGLLMKEMACVIGVSESAIKQRLKSAKIKLNAKTGSQAAARAVMLGII